MTFFTHPDIKRHIGVDKYNALLRESHKRPNYEIFCKKCYKIVGQETDNSFEDQVAQLLLMKYYFCIG